MVHWHGWQFSAGCQLEAQQVLGHWGFSSSSCGSLHGYLSFLTAWWLGFKNECPKRQELGTTSFLRSGLKTARTKAATEPIFMGREHKSPCVKSPHQFVSISSFKGSGLIIICQNLIKRSIFTYSTCFYQSLGFIGGRSGLKLINLYRENIRQMKKYTFNHLRTKATYKWQSLTVFFNVDSLLLGKVVDRTWPPVDVSVALGNWRFLTPSPVLGMYTRPIVHIAGTVFKDAVLGEQCIDETLWTWWYS